MKAADIMLAHRLDVDLVESANGNGTVWVTERTTDGIRGAELGRCVPYGSGWCAYDARDNVIAISETLHDSIIDVVSTLEMDIPMPEHNRTNGPVRPFSDCTCGWRGLDTDMHPLPMPPIPDVPLGWWPGDDLPR